MGTTGLNTINLSKRRFACTPLCKNTLPRPFWSQRLRRRWGIPTQLHTQRVKNGFFFLSVGLWRRKFKEPERRASLHSWQAHAVHPPSYRFFMGEKFAKPHLLPPLAAPGSLQGFWGRAVNFISMVNAKLK